MLFVTGGSGLLGSSVVVTASELGINVVGQYWRHPIQIPFCTSCQLDLRDKNSTQETLRSLNPKIIVHCAAATNVDWCEDHPEEADEINSQVPATLAEIAQSLGARLVYISTDAVFDGKSGNYSEIDIPNPLNEYARSKLRGEQFVRQHPDAVIVRVNIYGWNAQAKLSLAEWVLQELTAGRMVPGFTDVWFNPILVNDLAETILSLAEKGSSGIYHAAGSQRVNKFEFAQRIARIFGFEPSNIRPTLLAEASLRAARPPDMSLNTGKVVRELGRAMPDVNSGLIRFRQLRDDGYPEQLKRYMVRTKA